MPSEGWRREDKPVERVDVDGGRSVSPDEVHLAEKKPRQIGVILTGTIRAVE
jgi:hypothetical protein